MRRVTSRAPLGLHRRVFECERPLFVDVALNAGCISARRQSGLLQLKSAVWIVTVAATHGAFQNLVVEGRRELRFDFAMATDTKLRIVGLQHSYSREARLFGIRSSWKDVRTGHVSATRA